MFKVENLSAFYDKKRVLNNVSFELKENCITALCGLNGSGKSTLLSIMSGIVSRNLTFDGKILLNENSLLKMGTKEIAKNISYLIQNEYSVWDKTVEDLIFEGRFVHKKWYQDATKNPKDRQTVTNAMETLSISHLKNRTISTLSGGEFQKARIARCLAQETKYIFLDEPLSSIDFSYQKEFMLTLKNLCNKNKTICLSIHDLNLAFQFTDQIILIKRDGELVQGPAQDIASKEILSQAYNKNFDIFNHPITQKRQIW